MVEMVIVSLAFIMLVLGIIQFALIMNAKFFLNYASQAAARAGIIYTDANNKAIISRMEEAASIILSIFPGNSGQERSDKSASFSDKIKNIPNRAQDTESLLSVKILSEDNNSLSIQLEYDYLLYIPFINRIVYTGYLMFSKDITEEAAELETETKEENDLKLPLLANYRIRKFYKP